MFDKRSNQEEIMDDLQCNGEVVSQSLRELEVINTWLGGNNVTLSALEKCLNSLKAEELKIPLKIADLGCGGGDILKLIAQKARKKKIPVELTGIDANPFIVDYAKTNTSGFLEISIQQFDVLSDSFKKQKFDIVNCTLFCHHFDNNTLIEFLSHLKTQVSKAVIINDIHRHWFAYHSINVLTRCFSNSDMVKNDAGISVLRAFTREELENIILKAGYTNFTINWKWAFRYEVIIYI